MTNQQKYEEAAKEYINRDRSITWHSSIKAVINSAYLAGAQFAHAAREKEIADAHNAAIDKAIKIITDVWGGKYPIYKATEELEKLKL
jgi:hypothetical protein